MPLTAAPSGGGGSGRKRLGLALLVGLLVTGAAWASLVPATRWLAERKCHRDIDERRFQEAVTSCTRAFERRRHGPIAASTAMAHLAMGRTGEAWEWASLPESRGETRSVRVRGGVLKARGEIDEARDVLSIALNSALERDEASEAARAAHALAGIHWDQGRYSEAFETLEVSEREASRAEDGPASALAELARADIFRKLGDAQRADASYRRAIEAAAPWPSDQAYAFFKSGLAALERGAPGQARDQLERALSLAVATQNEGLTVAARINLANARVSAGDHEGAARELDALGPAAQEEWDVLWVRARIALERGDADTAIGLLEEVERTPLELDEQWQVATDRGEALALADRKQAAADAWFAAIAAVEAITHREPEHQGWVVARRRKPFDALFALLVEQGQHTRALEVLARYARGEALSFTEAADPVDDPLRRVKAAELLKAAWRERPAESGTMELAQPLQRELLVVHEAKERVFVGTRSSGTWRFVDAGAASQFEPLLHRFLGDAGDADAAAELGGALWRAAGLAASKSPLYILSTGRLRRLAFAALREGGKFWMQLRPLARLASLTASKDVTADFDGAPLVAGDPRGDLSGAREEARWVSSRLGAQPRLGEAATRESILAARNRSVLHLATHATVELDGARLLLADGDLTAQQILQHRPNARLVVLASCASGVGREAAGSDSLSTAFLRAGSEAVLATLRSVPDEAAHALVRAFYEHGGDAEPIGALAHAQAQLGATLPASIWSSFVVSVDATYAVPPRRE